MSSTLASRPHPVRPTMLALIWFLACASGACAQQVVPLVTFTNSWRYDQSGADFGTAWRSNSFNDTSWFAGQPLFGYDTTVPSPYLGAGFANFATPLQVGATITYYFRTHFHLPGTNVAGVVLQATNFVDDGCVIFLNGSEAGRIRVPADQNYLTSASAMPATEGQVEPLNLSTGALRPGDNVLAVEVHQFGASSSDVAFGLSLTATVPLPLVIRQQPHSVTNVAGASANFAVEVEGGPIFYQWLTNGEGIPGATNSTYAIAFIQASDQGFYSVRVANALGNLTSVEAALEVVPDNSGPRLLSAIVSETGTTNLIVVTVSEHLSGASIGTSNFVVTPFGSTNRVPVVGSFYSAGGAGFSPPFIGVRVATNGWHLGGVSNYVLTVNGIKDYVGNAMAPDSQLPVLWPLTTNLLAADALWDFHTAAVFDPGVFSQPWQSPSFVEGFWWAQGRGLFCGGPVSGTLCLGIFQTETGFQPEPSLFRARFHWPAEFDSSATLTLQYTCNDGVVFFLNGQELQRYNVAPGPIDSLTSAITGVSLPCLTNTVAVTNLVAGDNCLAAAVAQSRGPTDGGSAFGLRLGASTVPARFLPPEPLPELRIESPGANTVRLSWSGAGYALEATGTLPPDPAEPWAEVTNMGNPYTLSISQTQPFFRLRK